MNASSKLWRHLWAEPVRDAEWITWAIAMIILGILDGGFTYISVCQGYSEELNPLLYRVNTHGGYPLVLAKIMQALCAYVLNTVWLRALCVVYIPLIIWHLFVMGVA